MDLNAFRDFEEVGWSRRATAAGYRQFFDAVTSRVIEPLLDAAGVLSGMRVLDAGTGPGSVVTAAAARGAIPVGVDFSGEMIALARSLHPAAEFRQADVERLPFPDRSFDVVVGNFIVPHLAHPEQVITELARVLRPGGMLALSTWDARDRTRLLGVFYDAVDAAGALPPADLPPGPPFFRFSSDQEFAALLRGARLEGVEVRCVSFTHALPGPDALWEGVLGGAVRATAMILTQSPEIRQRIREAFDRLVLPYHVGGRLKMPVAVKIASGRAGAR